MKYLQKISLLSVIFFSTLIFTYCGEISEVEPETTHGGSMATLVTDDITPMNYREYYNISNVDDSKDVYTMSVYYGDYIPTRHYAPLFHTGSTITSTSTPRGSFSIYKAEGEQEKTDPENKPLSPNQGEIDEFIRTEDKKNYETLMSQHAVRQRSLREIELGETQSMSVLTSPNSATTITAECVYKGENIYILYDINDNKSQHDEEIIELGELFDKTYDYMVYDEDNPEGLYGRVFHKFTDKVVVLISSAMGPWGPLGYYWFTQNAVNNMDMVHVSDYRFFNVDHRVTTMAHELQHLIFHHEWENVYGGLPDYETIWLNEGLSMLAEYKVWKEFNDEYDHLIDLENQKRWLESVFITKEMENRSLILWTNRHYGYVAAFSRFLYYEYGGDEIIRDLHPAASGVKCAVKATVYGITGSVDHNNIFSPFNLAFYKFSRDLAVGSEAVGGLKFERGSDETVTRSRLGINPYSIVFARWHKSRGNLRYVSSGSDRHLPHMYHTIYLRDRE